MQRYAVSQFDSNTFLVIDNYDKREICICANYEKGMDAETRARRIAAALNDHRTRSGDFDVYFA